MKKLFALVIVILLVFVLTACTSVPVDRKFPSVPPELMSSCAPLVKIDPETTRLSTVVQSVVTNYGQYQECDLKSQSWIDWYNTQKQIFEAVK